MDAPPTSRQVSPPAAVAAVTAVTGDKGCSSGLCSVRLMRSLCPSCLILGLVALPLELAGRGVRRLVRRATD
ncbi:MAG: hypothetical protein AAFR38_04055 [Planctomycetota bacterium]